MPSPFPGMNPYLEHETIWSDFHSEFVKAIKRSLVPQVQPDFFVKFNEHIYIHEEERRLVGLADVGLVRGDSPRQTTSGIATLESPVTVTIPDLVIDERELFLEIFDKNDRSLVTVIELLSPSNKKRGDDRKTFLAKRREILNSAVHYMEIDLLRAGPRLPIDGLPECEYYVLVSRAEDRPEIGLWPIRLRDPLPTVPVPLSTPRIQAVLPLQNLLHQAYDEAGYASYIYNAPTDPALFDQDLAWAKSLLG